MHLFEITERMLLYLKMVVSSRKGYWKLSRTLATNMGMGNAWLAEQGLISLKEQWSRIHYPGT